jgi:hypothetical protein
MGHSVAFQALRNSILNELTEPDRRRLAALLGCMTDPQPVPSPELVRVLGMIAALEVEDRSRISKWCGTYLSRWGQIPVAASRQIKPK